MRPTALYRDESDILGDFIAECCDVDRRFQATSAELYKAHIAFCDSRKERPMTSVMLGRLLSERFERLGTKRPVLYVGLRVRSRQALARGNKPIAVKQRKKFE